MADSLLNMSGTMVLACASAGTTLGTVRDATDLIGEALSQGATCIAIPVERLEGSFFQLQTRVLGEFVQKFVNYRLRVVVVGDIAGYVEQSAALRDFVYEANRGQHVWFVAGLDDLRQKLRQAAAE
jgi:hypothetical protein